MSSTINQDAIALNDQKSQNLPVANQRLTVQASRTTNGRFWQSVDKTPKTKPYTARVVPPLLVGDLKKTYHNPKQQD